jgi:hypothetical protein
MIERRQCPPSSEANKQPETTEYQPDPVFPQHLAAAAAKVLEDRRFDVTFKKAGVQPMERSHLRELFDLSENWDNTEKIGASQIRLDAITNLQAVCSLPDVERQTWQETQPTSVQALITEGLKLNNGNGEQKVDRWKTIKDQLRKDVDQERINTPGNRRHH